MEVYKFGGASISTPERIKNIANIIEQAPKPLVVIVSAIGKTTNALEGVLDSVLRQDEQRAMMLLSQVFDFHDEIISGLELPSDTALETKEELQNIVLQFTGTNSLSYAQLYDIIVGFGELISSSIIDSYLEKRAFETKYIDMRQTIMTNNAFTNADVDMVRTAKKLKEAVSEEKEVYIMQGFIGGTTENEPTTLGREGSDYSAAIVAYCLDAEKVTIWKDVDGILNADPREYEDTTLIPQLSYHDAVELAYSGAQVIHQKTIRPLQNKNIPLYVKSFLKPEEEGSVINNVRSDINIPVYILKRNQILITVTPKDFSFAVEHSLERVFVILNKNKQNVSLIQNSAVQISVGIDESRQFDSLIEDLNNEFIVKYNRDLELLTIRGYSNEDVIEKTRNRKIFIKQQTRKIVRILLNGLDKA
ncbi:MAG: aspartate kinase [Bacteroidetes bacterium]|nr:aspartate kinase [Bacteroidota bacterium]